MVDVAGRADDDARRGSARPRPPARRPAAPRRAPRRRRARPSAGRGRTLVVLDPPDDRRRRRSAAGASSRSGARPGERHRRATAASGPAATRRRPWPRARRRAPRRPPRARPPRSARARSASTGAAIMPPDRDLARPPRRPGTARASPRRRRGSPCRAASRGPAGRAAASPTRSARPTTNPACGPPTSLSPLNVTRSAPAARRSAGIGSWARPNAAVSSSAPRAEVVDDERAVRVGDRGERRRVGRLREPLLAEVRRVDPQDEPRPAVGEHLLEVGGARPVRRPDLDQPRAGPRGRSPGSARRRRSRPARRATDRDAAPPGEARPRARGRRRCWSTTSASSAPVSATRCSSAAR